MVLWGKIIHNKILESIVNLEKLFDLRNVSKYIIVFGRTVNVN